MGKIVSSFVLLCALCLDLNAQASATFHVFPQLADGFVNDGTVYLSIISAVNVSAQSANCTIQLYGNISSRFSTSSTTFSLPASGGFNTVLSIIVSGVILPITTGYGTLTCTQPVAAQAAYVNANLSGIPLAGATVFSSPPTTKAELSVVQSTGYRTAFAIANNTDSPGQYTLTVVNSSLQVVASAPVSVAARSNIPRYVDELVQLPPGFSGAAFITSNNPSIPFSAMTLLYNGSIFISQPMVSLAP